MGRVGEGYNKPELEVEEEGGRALILNFYGAYQKVKKKQNKTKQNKNKKLTGGIIF